MLDSQHMETGASTSDSEIASEFATWIEHVTHRPAADYQPRHRAEGAAV